MMSSAGTPEGGLHQFLLRFISAANQANIVAGVQVNLLNELAGQFTGYCVPATGDTVPEQWQHDAGAAAAAVSTLQRAPAAQVPLQATAVEQLRVPQSTSLPQLHIQPLNLSAGLGEASACQQEAAGCNAPQSTITPVSHPAAEHLSDHAAAIMAFTSSMNGTFDAASAAAAATALLQQQKLPYNQAAPGQQQLIDPCAAAPSLPGPSTELLQALGYAADASAGAEAAISAAEAAAYASKTPGARKQRFTREQHAAILESVERNYAQYSSRYTELVIKEMQTRFPGIELNNACVRKIKFRANEASKQQLSVHFQPELVPTLPDYQAADAAHGLVGLASAAAAAAAAGALADLTGLQQAAAGTTDPAAAGVPAVCGAAAVKAQEQQGCMLQEPSGSASPSAADPAAAAAAAATEGGSLRAQHSDSPETVSISTDPVSAVLMAGPAAAEQQQQQVEPVEQQQLLQLGAASSPAAAAADRAGSPGSSKLLLKLPEAVSAAVAGEGDGTIDSATAAAAEAMHLLSGISSGAKQQQQQQQQIAALGGQAAAAAGSVEGAAAAAAGSKRKRESAGGAVEGVAASSVPAGAAVPLPEQVTDALSAAAELAGTSAVDKEQPALQQGVALDASATYLPAAYDQQQMLLQQQEQQQQQQALMQQLLQLQQQQQQPAWDMAYGSQMAPLELQMQQQQAVQMQLCAGLGSSSGNLAALQQQMQAPALGAACVSAAAAGGGQQPSAKRQRLSGVQMAELIASVKHHVQVNPERYTHCVIKDMKEKYPDLELNMGQIRKIKFRTLGNATNGKHSASADMELSSAAAVRGADSRSGSAAAAAAAAAAGCSAADSMYMQ